MFKRWNFIRYIDEADVFFENFECPYSVIPETTGTQLTEVDFFTKLFRNFLINWCPRQKYTEILLSKKLNENSGPVKVKHVLF